MKRIIITSVIAVLSLTAMSQDRKVAVFDPAGNVESHLKEIVREEISSIIVNTGGYTVLERQLIEKVLEENKFQTGGLVDDSQISEIGKRMGANMVFVTNITPMGNNYYVSCKMIDVMTARIDKQKTAQTQRGSTDLMPVVQKLVGEMFVNEPKPAAPPQQASRTVVETAPVQSFAGMLTADGRKVYQNGRKLSKFEVRGLMVNTDALRLYNKGISRNRNGNICIWSGAGAFLIGYVCILNTDYYDSYTDKWEYDAVMDAAGTALMLLGVGAEILGTTLKLTSKSPVRQSVNMYNNGGSRAGMELKFGITGNGVGLVLSF